MAMKPCARCGTLFTIKGRRVYCNDVCSDKAREERMYKEIEDRKARTEACRGVDAPIANKWLKRNLNV